MLKGSARRPSLTKIDFSRNNLPNWAHLTRVLFSQGLEYYKSTGPLASALQEAPKPYSCLPKHQRGTPSSKHSTTERTKIAIVQLVAVRDTPHIAQYLLEIVSQRVSHPFALFSCGIAQVSLRYGFCGGGIALPLRMLSKGKRSEKGGGYRTQLAMLRHQKPIARNRG